jgi:hypothetical protein
MVGGATLGQAEIEGQDVFKHQQKGPKKSPLKFEQLLLKHQSG